MKSTMKYFSRFIALAAVFAALWSCESEPEWYSGEAPVVTSLTPTEDVLPGTLMTITGEGLDLVKAIRFGKTYVLESEEFETHTETEIEFILPEEAPGGEVYVIAEDDSVPNVLAAEITVVLPAITSVSPTEVARTTPITITGTNLHLVRSVDIDKVMFTDIDVNDAGTQLTAVCPEVAESGMLRLTAMNYEVITYEESRITIKDAPPTVTSATNAFVDGSLNITGTGLSIVTKVTFSDGKEVAASAFKAQSYGAITLMVPADVTVGSSTLTVTTDEFGESEASDSFMIDEVTADPAYMIYDFETKSIGWGDGGDVSENEALSADGTPFYTFKDEVSGGWMTYFAANSDDVNVTGVTADGYNITFCLNVVEVDTGINLKWRINTGDGGEYWYAWSIGDTYNGGTNGWIKVSIPLNEFKDDNGNGTPITDEAIASGIGERGLNAGWNGGALDFSIDNVAFEAIVP